MNRDSVFTVSFHPRVGDSALARRLAREIEGRPRQPRPLFDRRLDLPDRTGRRRHPEDRAGRTRRHPDRGRGGHPILPRGADDGTLIVADGTSCRHQIRDGSDRDAIHVVRVLEQALA